jgi:hypothetical protein
MGVIACGMVAADFEGRLRILPRRQGIRMERLSHVHVRQSREMGRAISNFVWRGGGGRRGKLRGSFCGEALSAATAIGAAREARQGRQAGRPSARGWHTDTSRAFVALVVSRACR